MARISVYSVVLVGLLLAILAVAYAMIVGANLRPLRELGWVIVPLMLFTVLFLWSLRSAAGYLP